MTDRLPRIFVLVLGALLLAAGAGAAVLATQSVVTEEITVPYSIAGQTGQVVLTDTDTVQTVTETVTQTVTAPPPTDTTPTTTTPPAQENLTASQFEARAVSGASISNVNVTGDVEITHTNVTVSNSTFSDEVYFAPGASGSKLLNSKARYFSIEGADGIVIDGNLFDGQKRTQYNHIWDSPAGNTPSNWRITNNTFQHFWVQADPSNHSEALFIGYSDHGLISGNTFFDNGTTAHIFFSWWGGLASSTHWPNNICVKGNVFKDTGSVSVDHHYYAINFRSEIKTSANIVTDPNEVGFSTTSPEFNGTC